MTDHEKTARDLWNKLQNSRRTGEQRSPHVAAIAAALRKAEADGVVEVHALAERMYRRDLIDLQAHAMLQAFAVGSAESPEQMAQRFHEAYERLAPSFGYKTREASAKPWADVPDDNKRLMIAVCVEIQRGAK